MRTGWSSESFFAILLARMAGLRSGFRPNVVTNLIHTYKFIQLTAARDSLVKWLLIRIKTIIIDVHIGSGYKGALIRNDK